MNEIYFNKLLNRYLAGTLDAHEKREFFNLLRDEKYRALLDEKFGETWVSENTGFVGDETDIRIREKILSRVEEIEPATRMIPWRKWVAAAVVILVSGLAVFYFSNKKDNAGSTTIATVIKDVQPPGLKATLQLADGRKIVLDTTNAGTIGVQGPSTIMQLENGEISYQSAGANAGLMYNTLSVPRGSKVITLSLSDGTKVWLNAESSLHYPVAFQSSSREVTITGEAYFEVAKDARKPFLVRCGSSVTRVLGTHFNVNAYDGGEAIKVSLLEGSVKVEHQGSGKLLRPGQQASLNASSINITNDVDMDVIVAWKNNIFNFNDESLTGIMRQVARWYNVEIIYEGEIKPLNFGGHISRRENVSAVLKLLEKTGVVKFRIEPSATSNGKIIVSM